MAGAMNNKIPALGILCLNRGDLLLRLITSIDYPVECLHLLINTVKQTDIQVENLAGLIKEMVDNKEIPVEKFILQFYTDFSGKRCNSGVAGGWNTILKTAFNANAPYCFVVGNDICFTNGDLQKMNEYAQQHQDHAIIFGNQGYSLFILTRSGWDVAGSFDENIYPAYLEDCDHFYRTKLLGLTSSNVPDVHAIHGEAPTWGSSTIYSNENFRQRNGQTHGTNFRYYFIKWGGSNGEEKFKFPFDDPTKKINEWEFWPDWRKQNEIWGT